jgi:23S rRNA (adenine2503-C2)-methyltransferase
MWNEIKRVDSSDENVAKFVFEKNNAVAESVLYKYPTYQDRTVICCSTQSGCPVGCRFCGAGDNFVRSLSASEIVSQPIHLLTQTGVDPNAITRLQIMFMSMGEPLLNLTNLSIACHELYRLYPKAALLISTSAPVADYDYVIELSRQIPTIGLQFSVHESTDSARDALIPFKKKLTLREIADKGTAWFEHVGRKPFFNYCVHEKNNTDEDVARLLELFEPSTWECTLSVVCERDEHVAAANARQRQLTDVFMRKMIAAGYSTRMFDPAGQDDIGGGCGQLWFVQDWMKKNPQMARPSAGFGMQTVHTPR